MKLFQLAFKNLLRDWRSGELMLIALAIVLSITAFTSVNFFTNRVKQATELQATTLLAADMVLQSSNPINPNVLTEARKHNLIISQTASFRSVVMADEKLHMAEVKAVDGNYPIRGELRTQETLFGLEQITTTIPPSGTAWVDARLLQSLNLSLYDTLTLGHAQLKVERILSYEPDRGGDLFNIAPRLLVNQQDLTKTELVKPGSRIRYRLLLGGSTQALTAFQQYINKLDDPNLRLNSIREARPELRSALERAEQFLGLAVLVSIALAGLAIALSSQRYCLRHYDQCAIMRCMGSTQVEIIKLYTIQLAILALLSSLFACALAFFAQSGLSHFMSGIIQGELPPPSWWPVLKGLIAGLVTAVGFGLPHFMRLSQVPPMRVLRRHLSPMPLNSLLIYSFSITTLLLLTPWQSGNIKVTFYVFMGLLFTAIILVLLSIVVIKIINRYRNKVGVAFRYGLANVARRNKQSSAQIVALGLGLTVILVLTLVRTNLLEEWQERVPDGTPNYFLINIQKNQVEGIKEYLQNALQLRTDYYPMIRGRLVKINDQAVNADNYKDDRAKRLVSREFNLSIAKTMQDDNKLVKGAWWNWDSKPGLWSVEQGIADTLGINLGDELTYSIAGQEVKGKVTNLRWVEWDSFNVNFFVIANPGTLKNHPATYISSFYLSEDDKNVLVPLLKQFPSITVFDVDALLKQVRAIMTQVIKTIEYVFIFTLLTGIVVLLAALQSTHDERKRESALMSALGASKLQINLSILSELLCLGLLSGVLAALAASFIEWTLAKYVFQMTISINPQLWVIAPLISSIIIITTGLLTTRNIINTTPMQALRKT